MNQVKKCQRSMVNQNDKEKKPMLPPDFVAAVIIICLLLGTLTVFFIHRIYQSEKALISIGILALIGGLIFEYRRICKNWKYVLITTFISFVLSFTAFMSGKHEKVYDLNEHIQLWPYVFCFFFILIVALFHEKETTPVLTEGITLLQSIAILYWIIDMQLWRSESVLVKALTLIGIFYVLISFFHAFTYSELTKQRRIDLSIWSSVIMAVFAIENIHGVYSGEQIDASGTIYQALFISVQFFLLGVSSVYIAQNFLMLIGFLPGRDTFFNREYFYDVKELKRKHADRYSQRQIKISHAFICLVFAGTIFGINYYFDLLPRSFTIWAVFVIFPFLIKFIEND